VALDEHLRRAIDGAGDPADPSGVYEDLIRRRERRRMARRAKVGLLSFVVLVGTVAGVVLLSRVFATTPSESPIGKDIGLGFPVCNLTSLPGVFAPGMNGTAWVATKAGDVSCPSPGDGMQVVAVDVSGDGVADTSFGPLECEAWCSAFATPDVDGDGIDELLIQNIEFSIAGLRLYDVRSSPEATVAPVTVASPGYPEDLAPGAEPQLWIGGDAFDSETLRCFEDESPPAGPGRVLIQTSATQVPPDSPDSIWHATETWFDLRPDGTVTIVDRGDFEEPIGSGPPSFAQQNDLCGARLPAPFGG
jgi:hypothetical protein